MSDLTIFEDIKNLPVASGGGLSPLAQTVNSGGSLRRIQTTTNGVFKRIVGGKQVGKPVRGHFDAIIVGFTPEVGREYYSAPYDASAKPTLPDCWSNNGKVPDESASNPQASRCDSCAQNVKGSGTNGRGRACRFKRRVALLLADDPAGPDSTNVYQLNIPGASLFGDGEDGAYPFETYLKFLVSNNASPDWVVTRVAYDDEAETMMMKFSPRAAVTPEQLERVEVVQADPDTAKYITLTAAAVDGVAATPEKAPEKPAPKAKVAVKEEASSWGDDDEDDEDDAEAEAAPEPKKKPRAKKAPAKTAEDAGENLADVVASWGKDLGD